MDTQAAQSRRSLFLAVGEPLKPSKFAPPESRTGRKESLKMSPASLSLSPSLSPSSMLPSPTSAFASPEIRESDGPPLERVSTLKNPVIHRPSVLQNVNPQNRRGSEMFQARKSIRSMTRRIPTMKAKPVEAEPAAMHTPQLFKEYKYRKTTAMDSLVKVGPNNEEREIKRLSIFSAFGSRVTDTRPMSPAGARRRSRAEKRRTLVVPKAHSPKEDGSVSPGATPTYKHGQHAIDPNFMAIGASSNSSDDEEFLTPEQLRLRKAFKKALYATYFVGVMISFKNKVKVYGALRPIEYLEEFESNRPKAKHNSILPLIPTGSFSMVWAITIIFCLMLTAVTTPLYISFANDDNQFYYYLNLIMDISFGIDIVINFLSAYYDVEGELVTDFRKIFWNYFKMWFWLDTFAVIPIDEILQSGIINLGNLQSSHQIFSLLRFPRLYKLFKIIRLLKVTKLFSTSRVFNKLNKKLSLNVRVTKIIKIFLNFAFLNHLVGCLWFYLARFDNFSPDTWVGRLNLEDKDSVTQYIASVYWSFQTLTTVGYGDIAPLTPLERTAGSIWIVCGVLIYTFTVGNLSALLFGFQMKAESLREKLVSLERFALMANIPDFLTQKVRRFYEINHKENTCHWIDPTDHLKNLPASLRTSLLLYSYYAFIKDIKVLQINANLTAALLAHFKVLKLKAGEIIYRQGDPSQEIYFISKGTVKFVTQKTKGIFSLSQGTYFGELEVFEGTKRLCFCRALNSTQLIICPKKEFLQILQDFPDIESQMKKIALSRKTKLEDKVARLDKAELQELESRKSVKTVKSLGTITPTPLATMTEYINKILLKLPDPELRYEKKRRERKLERPKSIAIIDGSSLTNIPTSPEKITRKKKRMFSITPRGNMMSMEDLESQSALGEPESMVFSSNTLKVPTKGDLDKIKKKQTLLMKKTSVKKEKEAVSTLARINDVTSPSLPSVMKSPDRGESVENLLSMETKHMNPSSLTKMDKFDTLMDNLDAGTVSFSTMPNKKDWMTRMEREEKPSAKEPAKSSKPGKSGLPQIKITESSIEHPPMKTTKKSFFFGSNLFSLVKSQGLKGLLKPAPKIAPIPVPQTDITSPTCKTYQRFFISGESDYEK